MKNIQTLDPPGVGARDLQECLLIQVKVTPNPNPLEVKILTDYFEFLIKKRYPEIAKAANVTLKEVTAACENLKKLNQIQIIQKE